MVLALPLASQSLLLVDCWANSRPLNGSRVLRVTVMEVEVQTRDRSTQGGLWK